jgi:hypothetical protein
MADKFLITTTIAASGTKTPAIDIADYFVTHVEVPASMTGTSLTFEGGATDATTVPLRDEANDPIELTISSTAAIYPLDARLTAGVQFLKVVAASQGSARTINLYGYRV